MVIFLLQFEDCFCLQISYLESTSSKAMASEIQNIASEPSPTEIHHNNPEKNKIKNACNSRNLHFMSALGIFFK